MASASGPDKRMRTSAFMARSLAGRTWCSMADVGSGCSRVLGVDHLGWFSEDRTPKTGHLRPKISLALHHNHQSKPHFGMAQIKQEIVSIHVVNVAIVAVSPLQGPGIDQHK